MCTWNCLRVVLLFCLYAAQWLPGQPNSLREAYSYVSALQTGEEKYRTIVWLV